MGTNEYIRKISSSKKYKEKLIKTQIIGSELNQLGVFVCSQNIYDNFNLYEGKNEISVGIGIEISVTVYSDRIVLKNGERDIIILAKDINMELYNIFSALDFECWRAYGISNFDFAYYTYQKRSICENDKLMEIFIPKVDLRISNNYIKIKAFKESDIVNINKIINEFQSYKFEVNNNDDCVAKIKEQNSDNYKEIVSKAVGEILQDKYQKVILSRKICLNKRIDMGKSYLLGRKNNTPARSYYIKSGDYEVIGYSPETIIEVDSSKNVYTFPLAGTRAIVKDTSENAKLKKELLSDPKEISEHAISVKLAYEELQNVCEKGSVSVIQFMDVLERGTVQHLASRLKGKIKENMNEWHAFSSLFPAVTASGIPKKESIDAIDRLEGDKRGLYSGGIFTYDSNGTLDVALVLRSAYQNAEESWIRAGAGIVKLSNPDRELEETKEKLGSVIDQIVYLED